ncbi:MAG: flagellar export chaperone FliS [Pseudohongiella sp.]|nr:flagellar export chaperone FliS [Pseudohongiella sp.]MDO9521634.1 flagellar export chaperone FliS [Pseudohongiella sp.]MDP2127861.1 flagellar export chaperone FliS [Pseudohongiella sp.]
MYSMNNAAAQYKRINTEGALNATPHQLIQMLMNGALDRLIQAKAAMERGDTALKGQLIGKATDILSGLQSSLDPKHSPDLVDKLNALYDYMQRRLFEANIKNDPGIIDEVSDLLRTVKSSWDEIAPVV